MATKGIPVYSRRKRVALICEVCGKEYIQHQYRAKTSRYCSKECWRNRVKPIHCPVCGKSFKRYTEGGAKFCSVKCSSAYMVGDKSPHWKDGRSLECERARAGHKLKVWRLSVYKRDNFKCQRCGHNGHLHAHHIKGFADHPDLRFEISNGITLCIDCHGKEHGKDFSNRRVKFCSDCGAGISGKGKTGLCCSCSIIRWHASLGHKPSRLTLLLPFDQ